MHEEILVISGHSFTGEYLSSDDPHIHYHLFIGTPS